MACSTLFEVSERVSGDTVPEAMELHVVGSAGKGYVDIVVKHAWAVTAPLVRRTRKAKESEEATSCSETDDSSAKSLTSDGTVPSVDTDMDSSIEGTDKSADESAESNIGSGDDRAPCNGSQYAPYLTPSMNDQLRNGSL